MPFWAEQNQNYPGGPTDFGLWVRPIFSGSDAGILTVRLASGSALSIGGISGSFDIEQPSSASLGIVPASQTTVTLVAANSDRLGLTITNESNSDLLARFGPAAASGAFSVRMQPGDFYEFSFPTYTGVVTGLWPNSGSGAALVTELVK